MTEPEPDDGWFIDYVDLDDLADADRNAKLHDVPAIMLSIGTLGFTEPLRIDERSGQLNAGHGRVTALRRMLERHDPVPEGIRETVNGWAVPVLRSWASRDDAHAEAAATASNRIGALAGNKPDVLADQLSTIRAAGEHLLRASGYSPDAADELIHNAAQFRGFTPAPVSPFTPRADVDQWKPPPPPSFAPSPFPGPIEPEQRKAPPPRLSIVRDTDTPPPVRPERPETEHRPLVTDPGPTVRHQPAWRLLHPYSVVHYPGGQHGVDQVRAWAVEHGIDAAEVEPTGTAGLLRVCTVHLDPGDWLLRDGEDHTLHALTDERFHDRIAPANEGARRVQRAGEAARIVREDPA